MLPQATTATTGLRQRAGGGSPYHAREAPAVAEPCLRPAQVLVRDSRRPAGGDAGVFRPARWWRQPRRKTCAPAPAPNSSARRRPLGNPTACWAARSRVAPACAPPDGEDGAPGWGRIRSASGSVDNWPCSRPPRLSTTGTAWGEKKEEPGQGAGEGAGASRCGPPCVLVAVRQFLRRGCGSFIRNEGQQTNSNQKLTKGGFRQGGLNFVPLPTPSKKTQSAVGIGGRGWKDLIWCRKEGLGMRLS
jgi:hypothetical protein